jgi:hypothetical protein
MTYAQLLDVCDKQEYYLRQFKGRIAELKKDKLDLMDDLLETENNLTSLQSTLEGIEAVFCDEDGCPAFEPFTGEGLSNWLKAQLKTKAMHSAIEFTDFCIEKERIDKATMEIAHMHYIKSLQQAKGE